MAGLVPAISLRDMLCPPKRDARDIGERSDAVLRTAVGERSDAVLRTAAGERSDAVLRTVMGAGMTAVSWARVRLYSATPPARARAMPSWRMRLSRSGYFSPSCWAERANSSALAISGLGLASMK